MIRKTIGGLSAIQDTRNVGMIKIGQHLAFLMKALNEILRGMITLQKFYRYVLAKCAIITHGKKHQPHAACAQFTQDAIWANHSCFAFRMWSACRLRSAGITVGQQQIHCLSVKALILSTSFSQKRWPLR